MVNSVLESQRASVFENAREKVIATPALVVDAQTTHQNLKKLATYAAKHQVAVRPHTKTHKSLELAQWQLEVGCQGLTVAKVGEAELMAEICSDLLVAYPAVDQHRCERLAKLAARGQVFVAMDSEYGIEALAAAARRAGTTIGILIDQNVGSDRTGVPDSATALALAQLVDRTAGVELGGIFFYPGQVWSAADQQQGPLQRIDQLLQHTLELWRRSGLEARIVSGGSTPTAYQSHWIPSQTEIRPGTYLFNDMNTVRANFCELEECSAALVCTVVSTSVAGKAVIDAGSKTLTSDRNVTAPDSGHGYVCEYPAAKVTRLSEEHGELDLAGCSTSPRVGERVTVIPNHICPCVNLQDQIFLQESTGELRALNVDTRGKLS